MPKSRRLLVLSALLIPAALGFAALKWLPRPQLRATLGRNKISRALETNFDRTFEPVIRRVEVKDFTARQIVKAAHAQEGDDYDAEYRQIAYPGGDIPRGAGACTDVVIRGLRAAKIDLQREIHLDMQRDFRRYGDKWHLGHTDKNIDHRRVPNQITYFKKYALTLPLGTTGADLKSWQPGDIVMWHLPGNKWHTGLVSDGIGPRGLPLVIHNAYQCAEQDYLDNWPLIGHFRVRGVGANLS